MEYNTQLPRLEIPEYGRNIQIMIDHCCTIQDRDERNRCAKAIIQIMGQLNPHLRDVADFTHKLWDHLFIISKFRLDVDSPYPRPSAETFATKPDRVPYPTGPIRYRHYGRTIERIIAIAKGYKDGDEKKELTRLIANHMKKSYVNWNKDSVTDDIIITQLKEMSKGDLVLDETAVLASANDLRVPKTSQTNNGNNNNNNKHRHQHNNKHKHKNKHHNNRKHS
ncbi:MAG: DUF4290 domain-containing protein [Bacteroidetes bacterium]|nr:DUF4290 domain-containing protein [Bacteroidota bacterium]